LVPSFESNSIRSQPAIDRYLVPIFCLAIFTSSGLLFWVQPLFSKIVLPLLGGAPNVWNTTMMLFQSLLLAGYGYAHLLRRLRSPKHEFLIHGLVLLAGLAFLPIAIDFRSAPPAGANPIFWLVTLSLLSVGWPFFALSASAPLLQAWFGQSRHPSAGDPYFLYAASNLGSLAALISFPFLLEPLLTLSRQGKLWADGYILLLGLFIITWATLWRSVAPSRAPIPNIITDGDMRSG
jgi:hypothetical protein